MLGSMKGYELLSRVKKNTEREREFLIISRTKLFKGERTVTPQILFHNIIKLKRE